MKGSEVDVEASGAARLELKGEVEQFDLEMSSAATLKAWELRSVEPPISVELEVTETEPGVKGDTATGATKPAIVETGASVLVPLFVNQGDKIKIDTRTGEYSSRA